ncbi:hypothetical protein PPACK8108_LOCUS23024 [Phakopsora pachyrhizi]|uniref:Uncharacterized protein n=1 Tax=Phakopsora pachyrhizi TaxID=170000 RepID=A0AAV0BRD0_PHAPC|nr:hypothetical protein PPACK8108_LOCUS23024 [Phakopsora pachyrhizi]
MYGMMKKITRESKLSLQVDTYDYLGTKCYIETGWATAFNSALHELLNCSKLDAFVTNQTTKVDTSQVALIRTKVTPCPTLSPGPDDEEDKEHLEARDPTDQLVEGPYCQTEVVQENREEYFDSNCQRTIDGKSEASKRYDSLVHWAYDERKETI